MSTYAAFLRVYEPLAAFEGAERAHWEAYLRDGLAVSPTSGVQVEREASLRAALGRPQQVLPEMDEHAYVTDVDGVTLLCPWRTRLRALESLDDFVADLPDEVVEAFVPLEVAGSLGEQLDAWRLAHPDARSHQLTSTWQVPLRWFVLVDDEERELRLGSVAPAGALAGLAPAARRTGRSLVYRTAMSRARRRTARALGVLRRSGQDSAVAEGVEDLGRWLEDFHPRSTLELDYGELVHLLDDAALQADTSARDVAEALGSLARGDQDAVARAYKRVTTRMKALRAVESAS